MKIIRITEQTYRNLLENIETEVYNTPDTIFYDNGNNLTWKQQDAIPFFLLPNNKIVLGKCGTTHKEYYDSITNKHTRNKFINSVILQGRYWKNNNVFSFWKLDSNDINNVRIVVNKLANRNKEGFIFYKDKKYKIIYDDDTVWFSRGYNIEDTIYKDNIALTKYKEKKIDRLFFSDEQYVKRIYKISCYINGNTHIRDLNNYELLCTTCYQIWTDFLKTEMEFTTEEFNLYIDYKTNHKHSLNELLDYFHGHLRRKLVTLNSDNCVDSTANDNYNTDDLILQLFNRLGIDDSEYSVIYYENSELPYSYNVTMINEKEKFEQLVYNVKTSKEYVVDRIFARKIHNNCIMLKCRIRLKPEYDKYWKIK